MNMLSNDSIKIVKADAFSPSTLNQISQLLPQLTSHNINLTDNDLSQIIDSDNTIPLLAVDADSENAIAGMLCIVLYRIPTGLNARIEDFIVDKTKRGKGIGEKLLEYAINYAKESGVSKIELTSNPNRVEANNLYQKLNFEHIHTNVYQLRP